MPTQSRKQRVGEMRPSQLLASFGVGATIDLPYLSALVLGLDDWDATYARPIEEERLLTAVRAQAGLRSVLQLVTPPLAPETKPNSPFGAPPIGVPVASFPRWVLCPACRLLGPLQSGLFELKPDYFRPDRTRYVHSACSKGAGTPVLPARFLVACPRGHLDDFPWASFVHGGPSACTSALRLRERGLSGEASDLDVVCDTCNSVRSMGNAFGQEGQEALPPCRGRRPHLRDFAEDRCPERLRAILLGASNSWFPITLSVLAIPSQTGKLAQLVEEHWGLLTNASSPEVLAAFRAARLLHAFAAYDDPALWAAIDAQRTSLGNPAPEPAHVSLKAPEWEVLTRPDPARNSNDFLLVPVASPLRHADLLQQVILVERLREVRALVGFTRIEPPGDLDGQDELPDERRVPLSRRPPAWIPASEVRGEGIFLQFRESQIQAWERRDGPARWDAAFARAHQDWRAQRKILPIDGGFPGLRYVLLHSFSHILMRRLALACGYGAASLQERIYAVPPGESDGPMAGVLIYTAAPDSEGTLGGLVSLGRPAVLGPHLDEALEEARMCASDPLCAEHHPTREGVSLHGAACHACLFAPETACERGNKYLDRSVLVETVIPHHRAFFPPPAEGYPL